MAANASKDASKDKADKAKDKEREAKRKDKEREAKRKEKEKAAREKEKAAKRKEKEREAKLKEKEKAAREKEKAAKRKEKEREAKRKEKAAKRTDEERPEPAAAEQPEPQPVEEVAVPERGEAVEVSDDTDTDTDTDGPSPAARLEPLPDNDKTVRPRGYIAEALGKEDLVGRSTQRATIAASYTTRDHDIVRAWAESRGGRPADVAGTGRRGAGVLRIEFPDGPGDDGRLEDVDWAAFFATFDDSDVDFLYQERVRTGAVSRFHKFVRADG